MRIGVIGAERNRAPAGLGRFRVLAHRVGEGAVQRLRHRVARITLGQTACEIESAPKVAVGERLRQLLDRAIVIERARVEHDPIGRALDQFFRRRELFQELIDGRILRLRDGQGSEQEKCDQPNESGRNRKSHALGCIAILTKNQSNSLPLVDFAPSC